MKIDDVRVGLPVYARLNGKKVPATVLEYVDSSAGYYLQCKLEIIVTGMSGETIKAIYDKPVQSYKLTHRRAPGGKDVSSREEKKPIYKTVEEAQAALDRGEEVRIEVKPFLVSVDHLRLARQLQDKESLKVWLDEEKKS